DQEPDPAHDPGAVRNHDPAAAVAIRPGGSWGGRLVAASALEPRQGTAERARCGTVAAASPRPNTATPGRMAGRRGNRPGRRCQGGGNVRVRQASGWHPTQGKGVAVQHNPHANTQNMFAFRCTLAYEIPRKLLFSSYGYNLIRDGSGGADFKDTDLVGTTASPL